VMLLYYTHYMQSIFNYLEGVSLITGV
jgi:hypothetical protein